MKVLIFDQDGVIADTEKDGHRVAFNLAFKESGLNFSWDIETYGDLLKISGGKERIRHYIQKENIKINDLENLILSLHKRKTEIFMELISKKEIKIRSGIKRLANEAINSGMKLAICSTSNEKAVNMLAKTLFGEELYNRFSAILAGDIVKEKKPSPEIYNLVVKQLQIEPHSCLVIEDSRNGLLSANNAKMKCIITINDYTKDENFEEANLVVSCLGDPDGEKTNVISSKIELSNVDYITLKDCQKLFCKE